MAYSDLAVACVVVMQHWVGQTLEGLQCSTWPCVHRNRRGNSRRNVCHIVLVASKCGREVMRKIIIAVASWGLAWATAGALYGYFETAKGFSFLIGIPLYLPASMAICGTWRGAVVAERWPVVVGAFGGLFFGSLAGLLGLAVFMAIGGLTDSLKFRDVPPWCNVATIWAVAGLAAGVVAGFIAGLIERNAIDGQRVP
jgi:hypothetical protein